MLSKQQQKPKYFQINTVIKLRDLWRKEGNQKSQNLIDQIEQTTKEEIHKREIQNPKKTVLDLIR